MLDKFLIVDYVVYKQETERHKIIKMGQSHIHEAVQLSCDSHCTKRGRDKRDGNGGMVLDRAIPLHYKGA